MIPVYVLPMAGGSTVMSVGAAGEVDCADVLTVREQSTNTVTWTWGAGVWSLPATVGGTIEYAISHYENLLRRLAD